MPRHLPVLNLSIWLLSIPMRRRFRHATAERSCAEPIIVAIELADGTTGYGETHPRPYVTGETHEAIVASLRDVFVPRLVTMHPANFGEALEAASDLPAFDAHGRAATAARAAVELAVLDAYSRAFGRSLEQISGWLEEPAFGLPGSGPTVRYSGVISADAPASAARSIRRLRLAGLRDFKLKVGDDVEVERLAAAVGVLKRSLRHGRTTLRLDANGAWSFDHAVRRLSEWRDLPIACVEQPLPKRQASQWAELARASSLPLMADESLVTFDDAEDLIVHRAARWFNIRIAKNGGLIPALRLAITARKHGIACQLGCMVGETSILSAAGRWFLQLVPDIRFAEGSFGRFLLTDDVTPRAIRFGFAGRWRPLTGYGLGVTIDPARLRRRAIQPPIEIQF
ncbi:MAG: enolase C-terminal domain-like protein [Phycisphaerae bacterium]